MKLLKIMPVVVAIAMILPVTAASAQWGRGWDDGWHRGHYRHGGWISRNVSDPSYRNRNARRTARHLGGGCTQDLGYGRYETCD